MVYTTTFAFPEDNNNNFNAFGYVFNEIAKDEKLNLGFQKFISKFVKPLPAIDENFIPRLEEIDLTSDLSVVINQDINVYFGGVENSTLEFKLLQNGKHDFAEWLDRFRSTAEENEFSEFSQWMQDEFNLKPIDQSQEFWITKINNHTYEFTANTHTSYLSDSNLLELVNFLISDYFG